MLMYLAIVPVVLATGLIAWVVYLAKQQRIGPDTVRALAILCSAGLLAMLVSDFPTTWASEFWADHGVLSSVMSTVLFVGIGFLVYEDGELRAQARLDSSLTAAGLGGIVDHVVDVEVALSLLSAPTPPDTQGWPDWQEDGQPLRWLREHRDRLHRDQDEPARDPRRRPVELPDEAVGAAWRHELVDQCVRRLLAAIRDWAPVISSSRNGTRVLIALAELRKDLMELSAMLHVDDPAAAPLLASLRQRTRLLAYFLESMSGAHPLRPEVLTTFEPLSRTDAALDWAADPSGKDMFGREWTLALETAQAALRSGEGAGLGQ